MLEGLDTIDWSALEHAFGSAEDIPDALRAIVAGTDKGEDLYGTLWHQGSIYTATAVAIPFIADIIAARAAPDLPLLLSWLALVAHGGGLYQTPEHLCYAEPGDRLPEPVLQEVSNVIAVRSAAQACLPMLQTLLSDPDAELRRRACDAIGRLYGVGATALSILEAQRDREPEALCRAQIDLEIEALIRVARRGPQAFHGGSDWPASLTTADAEAARSRLVVRCNAVLADAGGIEMLVAANILLALAQTIPASPARLARAWQRALPDIRRSDWVEVLWFLADTSLRLAILKAWVDQGGGDSELCDAVCRLTERRSARQTAVRLLAKLARHSDHATRYAALYYLQPLGALVPDHCDALAAMGQGSPGFRTLLIRPLLACGHPVGKQWLGDTIAKDPIPLDQAALDRLRPFMADSLRSVADRIITLVTAADPASWHAGMARRLLAALDAYNDDRRDDFEKQLQISQLLDAMEQAGCVKDHLSLVWRCVSLQRCTNALVILARHANSDRERQAVREAATASNGFALRQAFVLAILGDLRPVLDILAKGRAPVLETEWLPYLGADPSPFIAHWRRFLNPPPSHRLDPSPSTAAQALWHLNRNPDEIMPTLLYQLGKGPHASARVLPVLREIGLPRAAPALPILRRLVDADEMPDMTSAESDEAWLTMARQTIAALTAKPSAPP